RRQFQGAVRIDRGRPDPPRRAEGGKRGVAFVRHSGAMRSIEPGISRFRVWSFGPSRNDGELLRRLPLLHHLVDVCGRRIAYRRGWAPKSWRGRRPHAAVTVDATLARW